MPPHKTLKGGLSFAGRQARLLEVRAGAGDGHSEANHQATVIDWRNWTLRLIEHSHPEQHARLRWLHSSLNGVYLGHMQTVKAVASGMTRGIPDLFLPVTARDAEGRITHAGLYIEMKKKAGGRLTKEQKEFGEHARREGYRVEVTYTWQEAARLVIEYLGLERHAPIRD